MTDEWGGRLFPDADQLRFTVGSVPTKKRGLTMSLFARVHGHWIYTGPNPFRWWQHFNDAIKLVPLVHANSSLCLSLIESTRKELQTMSQEVQSLQDSVADLTASAAAAASSIHAGISEIQQLVGKLTDQVNSGNVELPKIAEAATAIMAVSVKMREAAAALDAAKAVSDAAFPDTPAPEPVPEPAPEPIVEPTPGPELVAEQPTLEPDHHSDEAGVAPDTPVDAPAS